MMVRRRQGPPTAETGQILVMVAVMMVVLVGMTALAIDVSHAYLTERWERSVADEAALAGAQSLQKPGTRELPGPAEYTHAREQAVRVLETQLGGSISGGSCFVAAGCGVAGTPYFVSVQTPSPSCVDCVPGRAIQVSIWQPEFGLTFGRIFGELNWTVRSTSVAGMVLAPQYGIVTLRPSSLRPNDTDENYDDLVVTGGSKVVVKNADIATNSNATCSGSLSEIDIETALGFGLHHFGSGPAWVSPPGACLDPPPGYQVTSLIQDPEYAIPERKSGTPVYNTKEEAMGTVATGPHHDPDYSERCADQQALVPNRYLERKTFQRINDETRVTAHCYRPGVYRFRVDSMTDQHAILLEPGVYYLDYGARVGSSLIGGYVAGEPGVAIVLKEARNQAGDPGQFTTNSSTSLLALNFGDAYCPGATCPSGSWALPAAGPDGPVQTPPPHPTLLTMLVVPDPTCEVVYPAPAPPNCKENFNQTLTLTGGGNIYLAGVQYAPSDNATLTGGSGQQSDVGAFWAWTLEFKGGSTFNLTSSKPQSTGVLRIDPACSPNVPTCNP
jgi:hypothetical protein